jgi:hypothetical protein
MGGKDMKDLPRFLVSFIVDNQPKTMEVFWNSEALPMNEAENLVRKSFPNSSVTDVQVTSIHHPNNPDVHPGHYQQPEGN